MLKPKYDVAVSFLSADESIAAALYNRLSDGLEVFFYPRSHEALAGTNGLESMRIPFLSESCVVVVLYREPWGETPWTRVEQTAIQEGCLKHGWQRLFFIVLDRDSSPPKWLPETHARFNYADFGFEEAVGAIKARVQECGGIIATLTAMKRAELSKQETEYLHEKRTYCSSLESVKRQASQLFRELQCVCAEVSTAGGIPIEFQSDSTDCHSRNRISLIVTYRYNLSNSGVECQITVHEYDNRLPMNGEQQLYCSSGEPRQLSVSTSVPDMNRAREYG